MEHATSDSITNQQDTLTIQRHQQQQQHQQQQKYDEQQYPYMSQTPSFSSSSSSSSLLNQPIIKSSSLAVKFEKQQKQLEEKFKQKENEQKHFIGSSVSSPLSSSSLVLSPSSSSSSSSSSSFLSSSLSSSSALKSYSSSLTSSSSASSSSYYPDLHIDGHAITNITTQIGTHAYLPCKVKQLGNKSVSWVRVRDGHILTVDRAVFIADQRFLALQQSDNSWTLQIKYVQARDAGIYECQVSTEPKVSAKVYLQVVVPRTEIVGESDRYVKAGSTVVLRCIVRGALEPPVFITWSHGSKQLTADSPGIRMQVDKSLLDPMSEDDNQQQTTIGSLIIDVARKYHNGNYSCSPSNSPSVTVTLNVINGESSASAVTSSANQEKYTSSIVGILLSLLLILFRT
ncbi:immunoglobulin superfamily member 10-like [Condylostylus longicornis]|uniref:immunoglobulin superfamily member 10-like n=1 Tax=Condylostylus longicornis TaxID=2530218 RepID=UPI00244E1565|nr:immunoglobulin superfamily member 10-like [Condylostylus longicornis]